MTMREEPQADCRSDAGQNQKLIANNQRRQFESRITTEHQTDEAVGGAGGSVEEGGAIFVSEILFVVLTVEV